MRSAAKCQPLTVPDRSTASTGKANFNFFLGNQISHLTPLSSGHRGGPDRHTSQSLELAAVFRTSPHQSWIAYESFLSRDFAPAPGHGRTWGKRAVCAECRLGHTLRKIGVEFHPLAATTRQHTSCASIKDANHRNLPAWSPESLRDLRSWRNSGRFRLPEVMAPERNDEPVDHTCPARYSNSNNHCLSCVDHGSCAANTTRPTGPVLANEASSGRVLMARSANNFDRLSLTRYGR